MTGFVGPTEVAGIVQGLVGGFARIGIDVGVVTSFGYYSPSNARRFDEHEIRELLQANGMVALTLHAEETWYAERFVHASQAALSP